MSKRALLPVALVAAISGCGGSEQAAKDPVQAVNASVRTQVSAAQTVDPASFPKPPAGQSLEAFAGQFDTQGPQAIAASSIFRPPSNRLAFGLLDSDRRFAYGKTVVYIQPRGGSGPIEGPIAAPADVLVTQPRFRSQQAASEKDPFAAIYQADVPTPKAGIYNVLAVSDAGGRRIAAPMAIQVITKAQDRIPDVGEQAPKVATDTLGSVKGNRDLLDTRIPPAPELARTSFSKVVGKKPVALLFSTPQLCQSRVCGPVTDEMLQLQQQYGDKMTFIHQEVYVANNPSKGLRAPLRRFDLPSEPWLFTVRKDGTIAARLEGSIGIRAFEGAVKAALKQ
ncbi:MAG: hypothetical protein QOE86_3225 [Solirubrobacteraceae bacterium]|jgi:hypothetical protein|nr:hypothetical protein [Solirubrobacteraceae bacterium]